MEKQDLSNILIKETEFYIKYYAYADTLKRHNITTVGQLLSQEKEIMNIKFHGPSKTELYALIDMIKYRYLGIPLPYGYLLDNKIDMDALIRHSYMNSLPLLNLQNDPIVLSLRRMLANSSDFLIHSFVKSINETKTLGDTYENPKLIDFLTWITDSYEYNKSIKPYAKAYIEEYYRYDTKRIAKLKEKLEKLIEERQKLDAAIEHIQEQIDEVLNNDQQSDVKGYTYHKD